MYVVAVLVVNKPGGVDAFYPVVGENVDKVAKAAEQQFLDCCSREISNWDEYDSEDIAAVLEDGIAETVSGRAVIITHQTDEPMMAD